MARVLVPLLLLAFAVGGCVSSEMASVPNVHTVVPGVLIRGGQPSVSGLRQLRDEYGVRTVVNFNDLTNKSEAKAAERLRLNYLPLRDNPFNSDGDRGFILAFLKVIRDAERNGPVFVHCKTGMDRCGVAVAAYRILECGWSVDDALHEMARNQNFGHSIYFQGNRGYVRDIARHREEWIAELEEMPDPSVQRADADGTPR